MPDVSCIHCGQPAESPNVVDTKSGTVHEGCLAAFNDANEKSTQEQREKLSIEKELFGILVILIAVGGVTLLITSATHELPEIRGYGGNQNPFVGIANVGLGVYGIFEIIFFAITGALLLGIAAIGFFIWRKSPRTMRAIVRIIAFGCVVWAGTTIFDAVSDNSPEEERNTPAEALARVMTEIASSESDARLRQAKPVQDEDPSSLQNFSVQVLDMPGALDVIEGLRNFGYDVDLYEPTTDGLRDNETNQAIWVGRRIKPYAAIQAIRNARKMWPFLRFVRVTEEGSGHPHDLLFLGGANSAAKRYDLTEWTDDDFAALDEAGTLRSFHEFVRSRKQPLTTATLSVRYR